jgi:16S rRNA (guanine527-N7)-methyltransferase
MASIFSCNIGQIFDDFQSFIKYYVANMAHKNKSNWSPYTAKSSPKNSNSRAETKTRGRHKRPQLIYSQAEAEERLRDVFTNHGFAHISRKEVSLLSTFYRLLMENQHQDNFTRLLKLRDIAIKHFIDSMIIADLTQLRFPLLDLGTGPGFPGIPLKIHFPKETIVLAEGVQKRVAFLKTVRDGLNLDSLEIIGRNVNREFVYPVQGVVTRAVEDISNTLNNVSQCLQTQGRVYFMKGPNVDPEIPAAQDRWGEYYKLVQDTPYELKNTPHKRRLIIFEKLKPIPLPNDNEDGCAMIFTNEDDA